MTATVALFGAAGKIGTRIAHRLKGNPEYNTLYVEAGEAGEMRLRENGFQPAAKFEAAGEADVLILAVPDVTVGAVAAEIVPCLKSGAMVMCLDTAAPFAGELPEREDIAYFVVHPCHPPVYNDEVDPEAKTDYYGGIKARQNIVCALIQGSEDHYLLGESISQVIFAPVMKAHRITLEQMAYLEPAMAETVGLTMLTMIKEALDEVVRRGVPAEAAKDFLMGHININIAVLFGYLNIQVSDGAKYMVEYAKNQIVRPDWKKVFEIDNVRQQVKLITSGGHETRY